MAINLTGALPVPKGSMAGFIVNRNDPRKARAIVVDSKDKELKVYAKHLRDLIMREMDRSQLPCADHQPFELRSLFYLPRAKGHFSAKGVLLDSAPPWPHTKPDIDKLTRAFRDAATGLIWDDDSRIVRHVEEKRFASPTRDIGLWFEVRVLPATLREQRDLQQLALANAEEK